MHEVMEAGSRKLSTVQHGQPTTDKFVGIAGAIAVHLTLLWLWQGAPSQRSVADLRVPEVARVTLRLIRLPVVAPPVIAPEPKSPRKAPADLPLRVPDRSSTPKAASKRATEPAHVARPRNLAPSTSVATQSPTRAEATVALPTEPASAASNPDRATPSLLDTEATRRAIRESARSVPLGKQLDTARGEPERVGARQRLGHAVGAAGRGDCAKGEYPGAGSGLLSLPFLAAAVITGDCAK